MRQVGLFLFCIATLYGCGGSGSGGGSSTAPGNKAPQVLTQNEDQTVYTNIPFEYDVINNGGVFTDPEGSVLTYNVALSPASAEITITNGIISGEVSIAQTILVTVTATDTASLSASDTFNLVVAQNRSPEVVNANHNQRAYVGVPFEYDATKNGTVFTDQDGHELNYSVSFFPENEQIQNENGVLSGTLNSSQEINVTIIASDPGNASISDTFMLNVADAAQCNSFLPPPSASLLTLATAFPDRIFGVPISVNFIGSKSVVVSRNGKMAAIDENGLASSFANLSAELGIIDINNIDGSQQAGITSSAIAPAALGSYMYVAVNGQATPEAKVTSRVVRYEYNDSGILPQTRYVVLEVKQTSPWHHIGQIAFTKENYLLVGLGDGNARPDNPDEYGFGAQDLTDLRGSILRLDVSTTPYSIPTDNPFVDSQFRPEIYAYGLRNPWRFSLDDISNEIWAGDVGNLSWEEINIISSGANYGWPYYEGNKEYKCPVGGCSPEGITFPLHAYSHKVGIAIIGGHVYRGSDIPELYGSYLFGDYLSSTIYALSATEEGKYEMHEVAGQDVLGLGPSGFSQGPDGETYVIQRNRNVFRLQQGQQSQAEEENVLPSKLSETGCINVQNPFDSLPSVQPYSVMAPLWSDAAEKRRFISVPNESKVVVSEGDFEFPVGTTLVKTFAYEGKPHETRLMVKHDSGWGGYSYEWDWENKEATLLYDFKDTVLANGKDWTYPSRQNCFQCHTEVSSRVLGFEPLQLNKTLGNGSNQIDWLAMKGIIEGHEELDPVASLSALDDDSKTSTEKFKSYVHSNCSFCHQPNGSASSTIDFRYQTSLKDMNICNEPVQFLLADQPDAQQIVDLDDYLKSSLYWRVNTNGVEKMPPVGRNTVDDKFLELLVSWHGDNANNCMSVSAD